MTPPGSYTLSSATTLKMTRRSLPDDKTCAWRSNNWAPIVFCFLLLFSHHLKFHVISFKIKCVHYFVFVSILIFILLITICFAFIGFEVDLFSIPPLRILFHLFFVSNFGTYSFDCYFFIIFLICFSILSLNILSYLILASILIPILLIASFFCHFLFFFNLVPHYFFFI